MGSRFMELQSIGNIHAWRSTAIRRVVGLIWWHFAAPRSGGRARIFPQRLSDPALRLFPHARHGVIAVCLPKRTSPQMRQKRKMESSPCAGCYRAPNLDPPPKVTFINGPMVSIRWYLAVLEGAGRCNAFGLDPPVAR